MLPSKARLRLGLSFFAPMEPVLYIALGTVAALAALSAIAEFWRLR
jgi:hypothetical protein